MAIKPSIHHLTLSLSDLDRHHYDTQRLTVALHPSETPERLWARVLAWCLNARDGLHFTKGLSEASEPDLWCLAGDGRPALWLEVGEPSAERIKKATRLADEVRVYCFNQKADTWWAQNAAALRQLPVSVQRLPWTAIESLARGLERTLELSVTITDGNLYVALPTVEVELTPVPLQDAAAG